MPQIASRIQNFLDGGAFKDEFAHTILHNQDVFEEFRRAQINMKEQVAKDKQEAELAKKMQEMQVNQKHKLPQQYMENQSNDPAFFNYQYQKYQQ